MKKYIVIEKIKYDDNKAEIEAFCVTNYALELPFLNVWMGINIATGKQIYFINDNIVYKTDYIEDIAKFYFDTLL